LAAVLGVPVGELLEPAMEDVTVVRADQRHQLPIPDAPTEQRVVRELLTPRGDTRLQVIRSTLPVGFTNEAHPFRHLATESVTVVTGRLLIVHGESRNELDPGDTANYDCETPHWWANRADEPTVVFGAVTAAERRRRVRHRGRTMIERKSVRVGAWAASVYEPSRRRGPTGK